MSVSPVKAVHTTSAKNVTLSFLQAWNGGGATAPTDQTENAVAKVIKQKTGVTLNMQFITTPENERLNLAFASGDVPDIVNAPLKLVDGYRMSYFKNLYPKASDIDTLDSEKCFHTFSLYYAQ